MQIYGLNKTTLLDYPGHVAATVFTGSCNFRCPFCHNRDLVLKPSGQPLVEEKEVMDFLQKRKGIITGVCVTGGEPTLQPDLKQFLKKIKEIGLNVKLDTNGYRTEILRDVVESGIVDYVAMDMKSSKEEYARAIGVEKSQFILENIEKSVSYLIQSKIPYEFRTTVVKELHTEKEIEEIGKWLKGCKAYYLQTYEENENVIKPGLHPCSKEEMVKFSKILEKYIKNVQFRGMDIK